MVVIVEIGVEVNIFSNIDISIISRDDNLIIAFVKEFEVDIITSALNFRKLIYLISFNVLRKVYILSLKTLTFLRNIRVFIV